MTNKGSNFSRPAAITRWQIILSVILIVGYPALAMAANTIIGTARNRTLGGFAAGDDVILIRIDQTRPGQGMREEARTKTDARGSFSLQLRYPKALHLVRVMHKGVSYDRDASAGDTVSIDVFDVAANVRGLTGSVEIFRIGTNGDHLHVSDMMEIRNDSNPPLTQAGKRSFEVFLPPHAKINSVLAANSENIGAVISATSLPGEPNHYTVNFPLRPGATKFAFNYDLPYNGRAKFHLKTLYPVRQLTVLTPPSMKFASRSAAFKVLPTGNDRYQVEAATRIKAGDGPTFEISGLGKLPSVRPRGQAPPATSVAALPRQAPPMASDPKMRVQSHTAASLKAKPVSGSRVASPTPSSVPSTRLVSSKLLWRILTATVIFIFVVLGFLHQRSEPHAARAGSPEIKRIEKSAQIPPHVQSLKEEFLELETDMSRGTISREEYASARQALEGTIERSLSRSAAPRPV